MTLFVFLLQISAIRGQEQRQPLTNADVVKLVKAGLPERTIIVAIEQSTTNFDTSTAALVDLKNQGVSPGVIEAMLHSRSETETSSPAIFKKEAPAPASSASTDDLAEGTHITKVQLVGSNSNN